MRGLRTAESAGVAVPRQSSGVSQTAPTVGGGSASCQQVSHGQGAQRLPNQDDALVGSLAKTGAPGSRRICQQPSIPFRLWQGLEFGALVVGILDPQDIPPPFQQEILRVVEERHVEGVAESGQENRQMVDRALRTQKPVRHGLIAIALDRQRRGRCHSCTPVARRQDGKTARRQDGKTARRHRRQDGERLSVAPLRSSCPFPKPRIASRQRRVSRNPTRARVLPEDVCPAHRCAGAAW